MGRDKAINPFRSVLDLIDLLLLLGLKEPDNIRGNQVSHLVNTYYPTIWKRTNATS